MGKETEKLMGCKQAQLVMALYMENDPGLSEQKRRAFEKHLESCSRCAREYEQSEYAISLVKQNWQASEDVSEPVNSSFEIYQPRITVEQGWKELCERCPEITKMTAKAQSFCRVASVAACLIVGLLVLVGALNYSRPQTAFLSHSSKQVSSAIEASVKVEQITDAGNILIESGQLITAGDQLRTLLINDKHKMVMNFNTSLSIEPLIQNGNSGCLVRLKSGQIYTHVQHDENPFIVDTVCGKAVITGTTFDIKASDDGTRLIVSEGVVQFRSQESVVNVEAGQMSKIIGKSAPSIPSPCNTVELMAWVNGERTVSMLAGKKSDDEFLDFPLLSGKESIVLDEDEYGSWVEQRREWFKLQFPQIFQLQEALAKEGVEVEYQQLLIWSGDLGRFSYSENRPSCFSVLDFNSLFKLASRYGFEEKWLLKNVPLARCASKDRKLLENNADILAVFEKWKGSFEDVQKSWKTLDFDIRNQLFYASTYLANTRTLMWFALNDGGYDLEDKRRVEISALLQKQINAASICQDIVLYQPLKDKKVCSAEDCKGNKWYQWIDAIVWNIGTITTVEEMIAGYEISK